MKDLWGIDLGGTKIEGIVIDADDNYRTISRVRVPTEREKGYEHILGSIVNVINKMAEETAINPERLGIGIPGIYNPSTGIVKKSNTVCLVGNPIGYDLSAKLDIPVTIANDANCFALAETKLGSVKHFCPSAKVIFGIIIGSGAGSGIVVDGEVVEGRNGSAGEWGHNFLDESGGECTCGKTGCVETMISGVHLQKYYKKISGKDLSMVDIINNYKEGSDEHANEIIERLMINFGKAVAVIVNILDPDVIVLGGGVGNFDLLYTRGVEEVKKHLFNSTFNTQFLRPSLGDSAGVFGAALLNYNKHY